MARLAAVSKRNVRDGGARGLAGGRRAVRRSTAAATKRSADEKAHKCDEKDVPTRAWRRLAAAPTDSEGSVSTKYGGERDWVQSYHSMRTDWLDFALIDPNGERHNRDGEFYQETQAVIRLIKKLRGRDLADVPSINLVVDLSSDWLPADDTGHQRHASGSGGVGSNSVSHGWLDLPDLNDLPDLDVFDEVMSKQISS